MKGKKYTLKNLLAPKTILEQTPPVTGWGRFLFQGVDYNSSLFVEL